MQGFPSEEFVRDFNAKIHEDPRGDELLWRLEHKLCGLDFILIFVELYCGGKVVSPTRESISAYRAGRTFAGRQPGRSCRTLDNHVEGGRSD